MSPSAKREDSPTNTSSLFAPLDTSLLLTRGTGTPTFTRATTATVIDFEGNVVHAIAGEAIFRKARRVHNLLQTAGAASSILTDTVWTATNCTFDSSSTYTTTGTSNSGPSIDAIYIGDASNRKFTVSFSARLVSGANNSISFTLEHVGAPSANHDSPITFSLTNSIRRYSSVILISSGPGTQINLAFKNTGNGIRTIQIQDIQIEDVTYQANQNPSDYVSHGMGDDHGSNVDGVKYFNTVNANSVDSNGVVTSATGAALSAQGIVTEQQKINRAWPSENLSHANWTKYLVNISSSSEVIAGLPVQAIEASGTTSGAHAVAWPLSTITANQDMAISFFIKAGSANHAFIKVIKGAEYAEQYFNLTTGSIATAQDSSGTIGVQPGTALIEAVKNGYRCSVIIDGASTSGSHQIQFGVTNTDGTTDFAASSTGEVLSYMGGMQVQIDHEVAEYIPTITAAVTRDPDMLNYDVTNINDHFSATIEFTLSVPFLSNASLMTIWNIVETNQPGLYLDLRSNGSVRLDLWDNNGTRVYRAISSALAAGTHKVGVTFSKNSNERTLVVDGLEVSPTTNDDDTSSWTPDTFDVGCLTSGSAQIGYPFQNLNIWTTPLSTAELVTLTSP